MTKDDAVKVLEIMCEADGGCMTCAENLFDEFRERWPELTPVIAQVWEQRFGEQERREKAIDAAELERRKQHGAWKTECASDKRWENYGNGDEDCAMWIATCRKQFGAEPPDAVWSRSFA